MAYTEKVSISGTALSFLLYECVNSANAQEGFLIGDVTSEITNHISDLQSDSARLDTQIVVRTVLPLPSVSLFYLPTGKLREDALAELLATSASEVVGWYKFRKNSTVKPTFRDKLISKGLQKYFEKYHERKNFVSCNLTNKTSITGATHTFTYRFGKINCFDMYEYIEDVTANLGEKLTGYRKPDHSVTSSVFNKIIQGSTIQNNSSEAILQIQQAVNERLRTEAATAAKNECTIRELEAEIKQMTTILSDRLALELQVAYKEMLQETFMRTEVDMAKACAAALTTPSKIDVNNFLMESTPASDSDNSVQLIPDESKDRSPSPVLRAKAKPMVNYAGALKKTNLSGMASNKKVNNYTEDLISFDEDKSSPKKLLINDEVRRIGESSPEY